MGLFMQSFMERRRLFLSLEAITRIKDLFN